jgi:hypothetical protein
MEQLVKRFSPSYSLKKLNERKFFSISLRPITEIKYGKENIHA